MQIPKSAIFVAGLSIALFFITILVISITAQQEKAAKPKQEEVKPPILLEYRPNTAIHLIIRGSNENKNASKSSQIIASDYAIYDGITNKEINYTHWITFDFDPPREIQVKNNKLILTTFVYTGTYNEREFPFLADEFYVENGQLYHASVIAFKTSDVDTKTLRSIKNKVLKYKHRNHNDIIENELQDLEGMPYNLLILAVCGDKEAGQLLKDRDAYNKYFNIQIDGAFSEVHSAAAGAYEAYEYLRNQGGSTKEVVPLNGAAIR